MSSSTQYTRIAVKPEVKELLDAIRIRLIHIANTSPSSFLREYLRKKAKISEILERALSYYAALELGYIYDVIDDDAKAKEIIDYINIAAIIAKIDLVGTPEEKKKILGRQA